VQTHREGGQKWFCRIHQSWQQQPFHGLPLFAGNKIVGEEAAVGGEAELQHPRGLLLELRDAADGGLRQPLGNGERLEVGDEPILVLPLQKLLQRIRLVIRRRRRTLRGRRGRGAASAAGTTWMGGTGDGGDADGRRPVASDERTQACMNQMNK